MIKELLLIREEAHNGVEMVKKKMAEIETRLMPLINALNKATPFLEVFNAIHGIFNKKKRRKEE